MVASLTTLLTIAAKPEAPIACDFMTAADTPEERLAEYGRLFEHALTRRLRTADGVRFEFAGKPGVAERVTDLARREADCCPFMTYDVTTDERTVTWYTTGPSDSTVQSILDQFVALPDHTASGLDGLVDRRAAAGTRVAGTTPTRFEVHEA